MSAKRYAILRGNGRLWTFRGSVESFRTMREAQVWLCDKAERVVVYKPRKKKEEGKR